MTRLGSRVLPSPPILEVPLPVRLPCLMSGATLEVVDKRFTEESQQFVLYVGEIAWGQLAAVSVDGQLKWSASFDGVTWTPPGTMHEAYRLFGPLPILH